MQPDQVGAFRQTYRSDYDAMMAGGGAQSLPNNISEDQVLSSHVSR